MSLTLSTTWPSLAMRKGKPCGRPRWRSVSGSNAIAAPPRRRAPIVSRETSLTDRRAKRLQRDKGVAAETAGDVGPLAGLRAAGSRTGETMIAAGIVEPRAELRNAGDQQA